MDRDAGVHPLERRICMKKPLARSAAALGMLMMFIAGAAASAGDSLSAGAAGTAGAAMTADELIAKNVEARGGRAKLKEIKSLKATGKATFGGGDSVRELALTILQKRPGFLRRERSMQGLTAITAFDGEVGWSLWPFGGRREPEKLPPDIVKTLRVDADIDGPLVDYKEKGHSVEYLGT